jgi:hypothetical protein
MANPFPFVAGNVLTAAQLNAIGESGISYTPTTANVTVGNGTLTAKYVRVNKFIFGQIKFTLGSTSSFASSPTFGLPVTGATVVGEIPCQIYCLDSGVAFYFAGGIMGTTTITPITMQSAGTYLTNSSNFSSTVPFTWNTNDYISISFCYEAA